MDCFRVVLKALPPFLCPGDVRIWNIDDPESLVPPAIPVPLAPELQLIDPGPETVGDLLANGSIHAAGR